MKYLILLNISVIMIVTFFNGNENSSQEKYKYIGVNTCVSTCHKSESQGSQEKIWSESKHAKAFQTLQTLRADSIALSKGFNTPAAETPECVRCHTTGLITDESEFKETYEISQGVQCESCHGPGSEYKSLSVMNDRESAIAKGLVIYSEKEKFCIQCHNSDSPTYFEFNYEPMWEMIAHPIPKNIDSENESETE